MGAMQRRFVNSAGNNGWSMSHDFLPFAPKTKRKGYSQNKSPNVKTKAWAIVLLCTLQRVWVHSIYTVFQRKFIPGMAAKEICRNHSYSRVHLPFCIRILQEYKEKDWNLVSKFQSFYGGAGGIRTLGRLLTVTRFPVAPVMTTSILLHNKQNDIKFCVS